jgi:ribosomal protein S18 acetylase RimI-like enzyme
MSIVPPTPGKVSQRQQTRNALQRIESLEGDLVQVVGSVQQALAQIEKAHNDSLEIIDALVAELGPEVVANRIKATREEKAQQQADQAKTSLQQAVTDGRAVVAEKVSENSVIVGQEFQSAPEGSEATDKLLGVGYTQLSFFAVKPEFREKLLGQPVGTKVETGEGSYFLVTEIYDVVPVKAEPVEVVPTPETATTTVTE